MTFSTGELSHLCCNLIAVRGSLFTGKAQYVLRSNSGMLLMVQSAVSKESEHEALSL